MRGRFNSSERIYLPPIFSWRNPLGSRTTGMGLEKQVTAGRYASPGSSFKVSEVLVSILR